MAHLPIAVVGAAGHTGRFVMAELQRRGLGAIAIGRDPARLDAAGFAAGVGIRPALLDDPAALDLALAGAAAVINCAGPFLDTADAVTAAALRAAIHYLDVSAEQASAQATHERYGRDAAAARLVCMPAMGFYGGFADLLASAAMGDWDAADEIGIGIALDSWQPTLGTRLTGQRNTAPRVVIEGGSLVPMTQPAPQSRWDFAPPFGRQEVTEVALTEVPLIARHLRVARLRTVLADAALRDLRDPATPPPVAADASGRSAQTFMVDVFVRRGEQVRRASAQGRDIYAFTAPLVVEAAERILQGRFKASLRTGLRTGGALAPGEAFDAADFLHALTGDHFSVALHGA